MRSAGDRYFAAFALFVKQMSVYVKREAEKHGFEYIEMDGKTLDVVTEEVVKTLGLRVG
jgi:hypothetical protein